MGVGDVGVLRGVPKKDRPYSSGVRLRRMVRMCTIALLVEEISTATVGANPVSAVACALSGAAPGL